MLVADISSIGGYKMVTKTLFTLKAISLHNVFNDRAATVGEIAKRTGYSKSTARRTLQKLETWGYVRCELQDYKSTGKRVYWLTADGIDWLKNYRSMF